MSATDAAGTKALHRPAADEHATYFGRYVGLVPESDVLTALDSQAALVERWPARVAPERESFGCTRR